MVLRLRFSGDDPGGCYLVIALDKFQPFYCKVRMTLPKVCDFDMLAIKGIRVEEVRGTRMSCMVMNYPIIHLGVLPRA